MNISSLVVLSIPCDYCGETNNDYYEDKSGMLIVKNRHRIYIRSKDIDRKFIPIAYYCIQCKLFELDKAMDESYDRWLKVEYNTKTKKEAQKKSHEHLSAGYMESIERIKKLWKG